MDFSFISIADFLLQFILFDIFTIDCIQPHISNSPDNPQTMVFSCAVGNSIRLDYQFEYNRSSIFAGWQSSLHFLCMEQILWKILVGPILRRTNLFDIINYFTSCHIGSISWISIAFWFVHNCFNWLATIDRNSLFHNTISNCTIVNGIR